MSRKNSFSSFYRTGLLGNLIENLNAFPKTQRVMAVGDFNLDQMLATSVQYFQPLLAEFDLIQCSNYTTQILDFVFDNRKAKKDVLWMLSPYSDHFVIFVEL